MPFRQPKSPYWWISFTDASGERIRESSGTKDHAEAKATEAECRLAAHRHRKLGIQPGRTFDEVMVEYFADTQDKKSRDRELLCLEHLTRHFAGKAWSAIGATEIRAYKKARTAQKIADATIAKELWLLSGAVRHVNAELDWHLSNPVTGRVPAPPGGALRWLTHGEAPLLIEACGHGRGPARGETPRVRDFAELGLSSGMRSGEMTWLEWPRVDFGHRLIYFGPDDQKSGVPGSIPLNDWAVEVLRRRLDFRNRHCPRSRWVFAGKDGECITTFKKTFGRAAARAGLLDVTPHTLRHTFAAWLVQAGVPLRTVRDLCRHADIRTTMRYAHLAPENTREAIATLDKLRYAASMTTAGLSLAAVGTVGHKTDKTNG